MTIKHRNKIFSLLVFIFLALAVFIPSDSRAAGLVPCGGKGESACTLCHLVVGVHGIMEWGLGITVAIGIFVITVAGIIYMVSAGDSGLIEMAKSAIKNVFIGVIVLLGAWIIVNYGMRALGVKTEYTSTWYNPQFTCSSTTGVGQAGLTEGVKLSVSAIPHSGICGQGGAGSCYANSDINKGVSNGEFTKEDVDKYFSHLEGGSDCGGVVTETALCLVPKIAPGGGCKGTMITYDGMGNPAGSEEVAGKCALSSSCASVLNDERSGVFVLEFTKVEAPRALCQDGYVCCDTETAIIDTGVKCSRYNEIKSGQPICTGSCTLSTCINKVKTNYAALISTYAPGKENIITAIIAKESCGSPSAVNPSSGACGLMQILPPISNCLDPQTNIQKGVEIFNQKLAAVAGKSYGGNITKEQMALAAYNCCANGDNPNSASVSCATSDGWPSLPKWACPEDPGEGVYNMCTVRDYSCAISACF